MSEKIADLGRDERPRERMLLHGISTLSNAEIIALLLSSGRRGKSSIQVARELVSGGIRALGQRDVSSICTVSGVGVAKAARVLAAIELGRRIASNEPEDPLDYDVDDFARRLMERYGNEHQEHVGIAFLDSRRRIIKEKEIFVGTLSSALVDTREVVRLVVLEKFAASVVLYHNHPSGNPTPSSDDLAFTKQLKQALDLFDVEFHEHLIVGGHRYYSMQQRGQL